jgi:hypothetical protein
MVRVSPLLLPVTLCVLGLGCGTAPPSVAPVAPAAPTETARKEPSPFFRELTGEPKAGTLKARFEKKFPKSKFQVLATEVTKEKSVGDKPRDYLKVQVTLVQKEPSPPTDADLVAILKELQADLEDRVLANGMEQTPVKSWDKGFSVGYRSAGFTGHVTVTHPQYVVGGTELMVYEFEADRP